MEQDPFSLDRLQDIVRLDPVPWWPPAPVWWLLLSLAATWAAYFLTMGLLRWRKNAYRREAVRQLGAMPERPEAVELSSLLKRVALVAYPRERVASLSGLDWTEFLSESCEQVDFRVEPLSRMGMVSSQKDAAELDDEQRMQMLDAARLWIVGHQAEASS